MLQIHSESFSEDRGKCNQTGRNPSISDFSTNLTSDILILAVSSHLPSDEAYRQCLSPAGGPGPMPQSFIDAAALLRVQAQLERATFFRRNFHKSVVLLGGSVSILSHDICKLIRDHDHDSDPA